MYTVSFENFRCFQSLKNVEIRPITFLVGENSAGKTSFLAGTRFLFEAFRRAPQSPFNREPYQLGGYDQIAHFRRGRVGRAKTFSLSIGYSNPDNQKDLFEPRRRSRQDGTHKFTFSKGSPQPELDNYNFSTGSLNANLSLSRDKPTFTIDGESDSEFTIDPKRLPPRQLLRRDLSYLKYVFDELFIQSKNIELSGENIEIFRQFISSFRHSSRIVSRKTFATSPVRSEPLRTYTPSEILATSEGSHVPLELAREKIDTPDRWVATKDRLVKFGNNSGLFEDIDIRMLGKSDGDPFQIMVKLQGPAVNIMDVGYGVSQALPIIYQLQSLSSYESFLLQQPEVHLHPRAQAELGSLIAELSKERRSSVYIVETHSDFIIDRVRMLIAEGIIKPQTVTIVYFEKKENAVQVSNIYFDKNANMIGAPDHYREFFLREYERGLGI